MPEAIKVTAREFNSLLGLDTTKHADPTAQPDDTSFVSRFTKSEITSYLNRLYVKPKFQKSDVSAEGIISYLKPIHAKVGNARLEAEKLRALAPEIEQSRVLVSSSIMSPNDLQDGEFNFKFDNVPGLNADPDLLKEITELYSGFFNGTLQLGIKSYDWIGECQYGSGSKAILLLPMATQADLRHREFKTSKGFFDSDVAFESFQQYDKGLNDYLYSGKTNSWKEFLTHVEPKEVISSMVPSMEDFGVKVPSRFTKGRTTPDTKLYNDKYEAGIEDMIINLKAKLAEGDAIRITEDSEVFRFHSKQAQAQKTSVMDKLAAKYGFDKPPINESITYLSSNPEDYVHSGHPSMIELPSESVVPIFIPGAPSEHLGYFILLDQQGMPLTIDESGLADDSTQCHSGSPNAAFEAAFGSNCCHSSFFNKENTQQNMGSLIFSNILDSYIRSRMKGIFGRDDMQLARYNALSTVLFYRLLEAKESTLVFVPPALLHYFAFDYDRSTGTGKSKTSEIQFLLSLRTTLMMANVVAMVNDAIEHKKVEFGVDDKNANIEGIMELIGNIFIEKNKLNGSIDPSEIMRDMYSNALTIVPKNIPGLSEMSVEVQSGGGQSSRVDDALMEQLNNLLISHLDVPPAALNQISEPEFARSLVTYNLFFAKKVRRYQRIWCAHITEFIKLYTRFDTTFQQALKKKLAANGRKKVKDSIPRKVRELERNNPNKYSTTDKMINAIMDNVSVELATPNIVVDKTQFEEIRTFLGNLDEMANQFFNSEMVPSEDELAQASLPIIKSKWKRDQLTKFLSEVGNFSMVDIPDMDDLDPTEITDFIQMLQNTGSALKRHRENIGTLSEEEEDSSSDDSSSGDDAFSDAGGGGDFDFGGGDEDGGDSDMGEENSESDDDTSEDFSPSEADSNPSFASRIYGSRLKISTKKSKL